MDSKKAAKRIIDVHIPFECPFNVGFCCSLDISSVTDPIRCEDDIPFSCPLVSSDYVVRLMKNNRK